MEYNMAVIAPQTDVYLLKVPLEIDEMNQLTFASATAQHNYFNSLPKIGFDKFTYQRKDGILKVPTLIDDIMSYNYVMYRNSAYSNKWFYAFITGMEYVNDQVTSVSIKTDVWMTWEFDLTFKSVLIDREHPNTDTPGDNTLPEGLELGEMVCNGTTTNFGGASDYCTVIEVSMVENEGENGTLTYEWDDGSTTRNVTPRLNGITRGTTPLIIDLDNQTPDTISSVRNAYDIAGLGDAIINIYLLPKTFVPNYHYLSLYASQPGGTHYAVFHIAVPDASSKQIDLGTTTITKPNTIDGYTPKNGKLKTYPFMYFNISNNSGTSLPYRYEDFNTTISFKTEGAFGVSGNVKTTPQNYLRQVSTDNAMDYSITGAKYPICSWKSDSYTNWLTQNAVNMNTAWTREIVSSAVDIVGGAVRGGIAGSLAGGVGGGTGAILGAGAGVVGTVVSLVNLAKEQHLAKTQANMVPDQVKGNTNAGDFLWAKYRSPFTYLPMSVKAEYARCIDEYFSQFGYKTNRVKVPNITGRRNWNYVKTVGCYIDADIPQDDLQEIKSMFDKGITFWHNPSTFGDYSQANDII